jgi:hypothetical protein
MTVVVLDLFVDVVDDEDGNNIVTSWGYLIASDPQSYNYSTQDAVRSGNSFITILNHT